MEEVRYIDTNIFLRYLTADVPKKAKKCRSLINALGEGVLEAETSDLVIAELVWVLESYYKLKPHDVSEKVSFLLSLRGLKIHNKRMLLEVLTEYADKKVDFIDAYNYVYMKHNSIKEIYSYDAKDCRKLGVFRKEP